ncbi:hypothetical protein JWG45_20275 [Leptospira sp. 201903070]|jgi:hypothetical protein|uniref:Uncharacterized protein n=1 Tax=Leptospira ainlahdjerensis TaxID=2810033 RepID=A0ABS2UJT5_9LEPT|nr:hypothetical protein [Leptospira ainlahdjerensis]MBM9579485.1 hypothetical protein [Leptospira ainlahdjerensis]
MRIIGALFKHSQTNPPLFWNGILVMLSLFFLLPAFFIDQRQVTNAPVWLKPIKFALSTSVYSFTLVWILQYIKGHEKTIRNLSWVITIMLMIEDVAIYGQAFRGEPSHFNITSPLNGMIFSLMGTAITILWFSHILIAFYLLRLKSENKPLLESFRWGMAIAALGMIIGFFMTIPKPEQIEAMKLGILKSNGGHTFGAEEGGPGLPILGWSTIAGDMRIPHFIGIHAMQMIPMIALILGTFNFPERNIVRSIRSFSVFLTGLILLLTLQALNGESILYPSLQIQIGLYVSGFGMIGSIILPFLIKKNIKTSLKGA